MKVLIIGASGMLGYDLVKNLSKKHDITSATSKTINIKNIDQTINYIKDIKPEVVINSAAYTNVDGAETNKDEAYHVNSIGARNIAVACNKIDASLVYLSTDYVFDGKKGTRYREYDNVNPLSVYGKTKYLGEVYTQNMHNKSYIIRTSWLYGYNGHNFITTMLNLAKKMDHLKVVNDQIGSPTYTFDLADAISKLICNPVYGVYHITNSDFCSWYDFAREIFSITGVDVEVEPSSSEDFDSLAIRPEYSVLDNYNWYIEGYDKLRSYTDALKDYIKLIVSN